MIRIHHHAQSLLWGAACLLALILASGPAVVLAAEEYILGPEDVVSVTIWEHPELSRTAVVRADGTVTFPPLGDLVAAGSGTAIFAREIEKQVYAKLRITTQATVSVVAFNSRKVFLAGQVLQPGRYSFETMPDIVELLGQAGGLGSGGDLSGVRILRRKDGSEETINVDLNRAIQQGDLTGLPKLESGDVVFVPPGAAAAGTAVATADAIYVFGEVIRPGTYTAGSAHTLAQVLVLAGGPTAVADLSCVDIISGGTEGSYLLRVDLQTELHEGRGGPEIRPGDTIRLSSRNTSLSFQAFTALRAGLGTTRDVLNLILIRDAFGNNGTN